MSLKRLWEANTLKHSDQQIPWQKMTKYMKVAVYMNFVIFMSPQLELF